MRVAFRDRLAIAGCGSEVINVFRVIAATVRFAFRVTIRILFGRRRRASPRLSLPGPFRSIAPQAFASTQSDEDQAQVQPAGQKSGRRLRLKHRVGIGLLGAAAAGTAATFAFAMVYYTIMFPDPLAVRHN